MPPPRSAVGRVRLATPPPRPAASATPPADPNTPPPLPKVSPKGAPAARPPTPSAGTARPTAPQPFRFEYQPASNKDSDFVKTAAYLKNSCLVSLYECARITCQYESATRQTSLTPGTAAPLDAPLVAQHRDPATLAEERYKVARNYCLQSFPPPPPRPVLSPAEEATRAKFLLDPNNWRSSVEPVPATPGFWTQFNPMTVEAAITQSVKRVVRDALTPGMYGQMSTGQQLKFIGMVAVVGAAMATARLATAAFSFFTPPPEDYFKKPDRT